MAGKVRTRERCGKCGHAFVVIGEVDILCPQCGTRPRTFYYLYWHKRDCIISRDRDGHLIKGYNRDHRILEVIRSEIENRTFSVTDYQPKEINALRGQALLPKGYESKIALHRAPSHLREVKRYIEKLYAPFFGNMYCLEIRTYHVEDFFNTLTGSDKTKKNIMVMLKNFTQWLRDRAIFQFAVYHPIRPGELRALRVKDLWLIRAWYRSAGRSLSQRSDSGIKRNHTTCPYQRHLTAKCSMGNYQRLMYS